MSGPACMLDGHAHRWDGPPVTHRVDCEACGGTGRDPDADPALDDVRFPDCLDCGGEDVEVDSTCSLCGVRQSDADAWADEGPAATDQA